MTDYTEHEYDDGWALVQNAHGDDEVIDIPAQCPSCPPDASIDFWWDAEGIPHCLACDPPGVRAIRGERVRQLATRFKEENSGRVVPKAIPVEIEMIE